MVQTIKYTTLRVGDIETYRAKMLDLYDPERRRPREYMRSIRRADTLVIAECEQTVVGSVRGISDWYMCAMIIDLLVLPEYRTKGIGGKLIRQIVGSYKRKGIKNISLVADPSDPWLVPFYSDLGFEYSPDNGVYMQFKKA